MKKLPIIEVTETVKRVYSCEFDYDAFIEWLEDEEPSEEMLEAYIYDILLDEASYNEDFIDSIINEDLSKLLKNE